MVSCPSSKSLTNVDSSGSTKHSQVLPVRYALCERPTCIPLLSTLHTLWSKFLWPPHFADGFRGLPNVPEVTLLQSSRVNILILVPLTQKPHWATHPDPHPLLSLQKAGFSSWSETISKTNKGTRTLESHLPLWLVVYFLRFVILNLGNPLREALCLFFC